MGHKINIKYALRKSTISFSKKAEEFCRRPKYCWRLAAWSRRLRLGPDLTNCYLFSAYVKRLEWPSGNNVDLEYWQEPATPNSQTIPELKLNVSTIYGLQSKQHPCLSVHIYFTPEDMKDFCSKYYSKILLLCIPSL